MFFCLLSALLSISAVHAKDVKNETSAKTKKVAAIDSTAVGQKLKIFKGKYRLMKGPEDQCYSGLLEVEQISEKRATIMLGGRPLAVKLDVNPVVEKVTEGACARLTKSELREQTALQTLDVTCKDASKNYSLGRKVSFQDKNLSYGIVYKGSDKTETVNCELTLIE